MNLWIRLLCYLLTLPWRPKLQLPHETSVVRFRVWPHDMDTSGHMNNGRYLTIMDLGRLDLMVSGGFVRAALRHGWTPFANSVEIRFRRELVLFDRFEVRSRIVGWRERDVVIEQVFISLTKKRQGQVAARALFAGGLYDRKAKTFVPVSRMMQEIGVAADSPPLSDEAEAFLEAVERLRDVDRVDDP